MHQLAFETLPFEHENPLQAMHQLGSPSALLSLPDNNRAALIDLLQQLLRKNAGSRLSSFAELMSHPFFSSVDWDALEDPKAAVPVPERILSFLSALFAQPVALSEAARCALPEELYSAQLPPWLESPVSREMIIVSAREAPFVQERSTNGL